MTVVMTLTTFLFAEHEAIGRLFEMDKFDSMTIATITGYKDIRTLARYTHLRAENLAAMMR